MKTNKNFFYTHKIHMISFMIVILYIDDEIKAEDAYDALFIIFTCKYAYFLKCIVQHKTIFTMLEISRPTPE